MDCPQTLAALLEGLATPDYSHCGREGGREEQQIPPAVDFPQVPLVRGGINKERACNLQRRQNVNLYSIELVQTMKPYMAIQA